MSPDPSRAADVLLRPPAPRGRLHWPPSSPPFRLQHGGSTPTRSEHGHHAGPAGTGTGTAHAATPGLVVLLTGPGGGRFGGPLCRALDAVVLAVAPAGAAAAGAALAWAADHAVELGADPDRLAVLGHGRGAVLAGRVARRAARDGWPPVRAVVTAGTADEDGAALLAAAGAVLGGRWGR